MFLASSAFGQTFSMYQIGNKADLTTTGLGAGALMVVLNAQNRADCDLGAATGAANAFCEWDGSTLRPISYLADAVMDGDSAGGDLSGTYPSPSVVDSSHAHNAATAPGTIDGSGTANRFALWTDSDTLAAGPLFKAAASDNVGIGTANPAQPLHVKASTLAEIQVESADATNTDLSFKNTAREWLFRLNSAGAFALVDAGGVTTPVSLQSGAPNDSIRVLSSGNVGIGTASPAVRLSVENTSVNGDPATSGTTQTHGLLRLDGSAATVLDFGVNGSAARVWIQATVDNDLSGVRHLVLNPLGGGGGRVGIATGTSNPTETLHVGGSARITGLVSCDTVDTDANGVLSCGTDATGAHGNGANCSAGNAPLGVDANGAVEGCFDVATQTELDAKSAPTSTNNAVAKFSGTSGDLQNSGVIIDASNNITGVGTFASGNVNVTGTVTLSSTVDANGTGTHDFEGTVEWDAAKWENDPAAVAFPTTVCHDGVAGGGATLGACASTRRLKQEIQTLQGGLSALARLRPTQFRWIAEPELQDVGLIAEEVGAVDPRLVRWSSDGEAVQVNELGVIALLVHAVQDLALRVERLEQIPDHKVRP